MSPNVTKTMLLCSLLACATSGDPASGTETDASATFTPGSEGSTQPDPTSDPKDDDDDVTPDPDDSTTSMDRDTSTGATDTTDGCVPGAEGCACLPDADPPCDEGLVCTDDVCVMPLCPADDDEPNDLQSQTIAYADIGEGSPPQQLVGSLSGVDDVDWWSYHCDDLLNPFGEISPQHQLSTTDPMPRFCVFMDCDIGGNPIFADGCPPGTSEEQAPTGFLPGCCTLDGSPIDLTDFNCPDSSDESVTVYFRIDQAPEDVCIEYAIDFSC